MRKLGVISVLRRRLGRHSCRRGWLRVDMDGGEAERDW